jgi:tRNA G18 (ribose-2'-O)-methylase SpoU
MNAILPINFGFNVLDHIKDRTVPQLKEISDNDRLPYAVLMLNLEHDLNIGNIIRSAHLLGAERVIIVGNNKVDTRACVGSQNYTNIEKFKIPEGMTIEEAVFGQLTKFNYFLIFVEYNDSSVSVETIGLYAKSILSTGMTPCLVVGNEQAGIPACLMRGEYPVVHIDQRGVLRSFNVSSAASIVIWELSKFLAASLK